MLLDKMTNNVVSLCDFWCRFILFGTLCKSPMPVNMELQGKYYNTSLTEEKSLGTEPEQMCHGIRGMKTRFS